MVCSNRNSFMILFIDCGDLLRNKPFEMIEDLTRKLTATSKACAKTVSKSHTYSMYQIICQNNVVVAVIKGYPSLPVMCISASNDHAMLLHCKSSRTLVRIIINISPAYFNFQQIFLVHSRSRACPIEIRT